MATFNQRGKRMSTILVVDAATEVYNRQTAIWAKYDVGIFRVDTLYEAVKLLAQGERYLFVGINEDINPDFLLLLPILRDVATIPIYVITSTFTATKKIAALHLGADGYESFSIRTEDIVLVTLELLNLIKRMADYTASKTPVLIGGDIILSPLRRNVFVNGVEVMLTKKEFDILFYLMSNRRILLTYDQISCHVWGNDYYNTTAEIIRTHMKRLRMKLEAVSPPCRYLIENQYGEGYRFTA